MTSFISKSSYNRMQQNNYRNNCAIYIKVLKIVLQTTGWTENKRTCKTVSRNIIEVGLCQDSKHVFKYSYETWKILHKI